MNAKRVATPRLFLACMALILGLGAISLLAACAQEAEDETQPSSQTEYYEHMNDWADRYVQCLRDRGVDARIVVQEDGLPSISPAVAPGTDPSELWNGMLDPACIESAGEPPELPAATEDFKVAAYQLASEQAECLRQNGYVVSEAPSLEQWVEEWDGARWDPVGEAGENGHDVFELTAACPDPTGLTIEERMLENQEQDGSDE